MGCSSESQAGSRTCCDPSVAKHHRLQQDATQAHHGATTLHIFKHLVSWDAAALHYWMKSLAEALGQEQGCYGAVHFCRITVPYKSRCILSKALSELLSLEMEARPPLRPFFASGVAMHSSINPSERRINPVLGWRSQFKKSSRQSL